MKKPAKFIDMPFAAAPSKRSAAKAVLLAGAQIAASIVLLAAIARLLNPAELQRLFHDTMTPWLVVAFAILVVQQLLTAERWRLVSAALSTPPHTFSFYLFWQGIGSLCSMVLPSIIGADLVRTYALSRRTVISTVIRVVIVDRALGLLALSALVLIGVVVAPRFFLAHTLMLIPVLIALTGVATYLILTRGFHNWTSANLIVLPGRILGSDLRKTVEGSARNWRITASLAIHILSIGAFIALGKAISLEGVVPLDYLKIVPGALLVTVIPFSIGGWGLRESAVIIGFSLLGVSAEKAFALSVMFGVLSMASALIPTLFGSYWFLEARTASLMDGFEAAQPLMETIKERMKAAQKF